MTEKEKKTEEVILEAAQDVFVEKGMHGARMQEIADKAKINKSLLHYYYRSKDLLFNAVFKLVIKRFVPKIEAVIQSDESIVKKIEKFVSNYIDLLSRNQFIPIFVLQEINRDPDRLYKIMKDSGINPEPLMEKIMLDLKSENLIEIDPKQLFINILSLCVFPIAGRSMMQRIFFDNDKKAYDAFLAERKTEVSKFVINSITKK